MILRTTHGTHTMPHGTTLADAVAALKLKGIQFTGVIVDGIWQTRSTH